MPGVKRLRIGESCNGGKYVCIPKAWADVIVLRKGDLVQVRYEDTLEIIPRDDRRRGNGVDD